MRWFLLLAAYGCGDNDRGDPFEVRSGSRLELRSWLYEDGAQQWDRERLFDAKLGVDCTVQRWSDGLSYCTPEEAASLVYGDEACQEPLGHVPITSGMIPRFYLRTFRLDGSLLPSRMYQRTSDAPVQRSQFWVFTSTGCEGPYENRDGLLYPVEQIELVGIHETAPLGDGRLRLTMLTSDDGMQLSNELHDTSVEAPCELSQQVDGTRVCVPTHIAPITYFRDNACTSPVVVFARGQTRTNVAAIFDHEGCPTYFRVGAEESKYPLHTIVNGACTEIELPDSDIVFGLAGELELARLEARVTHEARIRTEELFDGSLHLPSPTVFDTRLATSCIRVYGKFDVRCVPEGTATMVRYYLDDACSSGPFRLAQARRSACSRSTQFAAGTTFDTNVTVYEVADPIVEPVYTHSGQCEVVALDPGMALYNLGPLVPVTEFATVRLED